MKNNPYYMNRADRLGAKARIDELLLQPICKHRWEADYVPEISLVYPSSENG